MGRTFIQPFPKNENSERSLALSLPLLRLVNSPAFHTNFRSTLMRHIIPVRFQAQVNNHSTSYLKIFDCLRSNCFPFTTLVPHPVPRVGRVSVWQCSVFELKLWDVFFLPLQTSPGPLLTVPAFVRAIGHTIIVISHGTDC